MKLIIFTQVMAAMAATTTATSTNHALLSRAMNSASRLGQDECSTEADALATCVGDECIGCLTEAVEDYSDVTTCAELAGSDFCKDVLKCVYKCWKIDFCEEKLDAYAECVDDLPEDDPDCEELCIVSEDEEEEEEEEATPEEGAISSVDYHAVFARSVKSAALNEDVCTTEASALQDCLGDECVSCVSGVVEDYSSATSCSELASSEFCEDVIKCMWTGGCWKIDFCEEKVEDYAECMDDVESDDQDCDDLCGPLVVEEEASPKEVVLAKTEEVAASTHILFARAMKTAALTQDECSAESTAVQDCVGGECVSCISEVVGDYSDATSCADLATSDFCEDILKCMAFGDCWKIDFCEEQVEDYAECMDDVESHDPDCDELCIISTVTEIA